MEHPVNIKEGEAVDIAKKRMINMTEGKVFSKVLLFVLPLMATNLLQTLYNAADMVVVGLSHEPDAVGAVGVTGSFITLVVNVFMGFATGANVIIASQLGARDDKNASKTVHTSLLLSVILGIVGGVIGFAVARPVLALMGAEGKLLDLATLYTKIYFCGVPFLSITNYEIAIFRAKGDTKTPLFVLAGAGLLNVVLNMVFVFAFKLSVEGVALATAISNIASGIVLLFILSRDESPCRFSFKKLAIDRRALGGIVKIGLPAGIQGSLFSVSNMVVQSSILQVNNSICPPGSAFQPVVKGNAAAQSLESFLYQATNAVYQASITFTSQNAGAGKHKRIWRVMGSCYSLTFLIAAVFVSIMFIFKAPFLALYGVNDSVAGSLEHIAFEASTSRMNITFTTYFLLAFMEVGCGVVRGLGKSTASTMISFIGSCLLRMGWILTVFAAFPTLEIIYVAYPISWGVTALAQFVYSAVMLKRAKNRGSL